MKSFLALSVLISFTAQATHLGHPPHLDLDATSDEYAAYLNQEFQLESFQSDEPSIAAALRIGARLSGWLKDQNSRRPADRQIRLTSATTRYGIPIETPNKYNPDLIQTKLDTAMAALPAAMAEVLNGTSAYPAQLPIADAEFVTLGRAVDKVYQSAARWKSLKPWIPEYTENKARDVRGYYFLKKNDWTPEKLANFGALDSETQKQLKGWLVLTCLNLLFSDQATCTRYLNEAIASNKVADYYNDYHAAAESNWNDFFAIPATASRRDIVWNSSNINMATVPFNTPTSARIKSYLSANIEDEWKFGDWGLRLNFGSFPSGPRVEFQTGVVPHVNGLGGNVIVMDENQPVEEYESQWTIRHEFGHVLGFPDCYHEFYDTEIQAFVNYQLDTSDLMCSRAGNMKERLFNEMKRVYFH